MSHDREHFLEYRKQTLVKHTILEGYLPAYFTAMGTYPHIIYFDAFAGPGHYHAIDGAVHSGSPIRTLNLVSEKKDFARTVWCLFSEHDPVLFRQLEKAVGEHPGLQQIRKAPVCENMAFTDCFNKHRSSIMSGDRPVFLFADPCGAKGIDHEVIAQVLQKHGSELFLFFNSSALRRIIGAIDFDPANFEIVKRLFGSDLLASSVVQKVKQCTTPTMRENALLEAYSRLLAETAGKEFVLAFRIEYEKREDTSHYLVYATKSGLGYRLMKYVMRDFLARKGQTSGEMELRQSSYVGNSLFKGVEVEEAVLKVLANGPSVASHFLKNLPESPGDLWSEVDYKEAIFSLERKGRVEVFKDSSLRVSYPLVERIRKRPHHDEYIPTLGPRLWISLASGRLF